MTNQRSETTKPTGSRTPARNSRAVQSEHRRTEILRASKEVLAQGYAGFSLRKVATTAGVRLNTVQHHFNDLESLIHATIESLVGGFMRRSRQLAEGQYDSPTDDLMVFLDDAWVWIRDANVRNLYFEVWAMARHHPSVVAMIQRIYSEYVGALALILRRINPRLTEVDACGKATLISCWTEGAIVMAHWWTPGTPSLGLLAIRMKSACLALADAADLRTAWRAE